MSAPPAHLVSRRRVVPALLLLLIGDLRALLRAPGQTLFTLTGICIAVALVVGVDLANDAARRGYEVSFARLNAGVNFAISAAARPLTDNDYVQLLGVWRAGRLPGVNALVPNVRGRLRAADGHVVDLLGVDLLSDRATRATTSRMRLLPASMPMLLTERGAVIAGQGAAGTADNLLLNRGYKFTRFDGVAVTVQVRAQLDERNGDYRDLLISDVATAQELLGMVGQLSRIDLALSCTVTPNLWQRWFPGLTRAADPHCADELAKALPRGYQLRSLAALREDDLASGDAFYFNLGALSLLAAAVAAFLVYQVVTLGVNRRAVDFGRLRALGMTGRELAVRVVVGYVTLAACAGVLGVLLGRALAILLVGRVAAVVDDLFYRLTITDLQLTGLGVAKGMSVAVGVALAASMLPALRLARTPVVALLRGELDRRALVAPWLFGVVMALFGVALLLLSNATWAALASIACFLIAAAASIGLLLPRVRPRLCRRGGFSTSVLAPLALADLGRTGRDASLALGALLVAVATALGMTWMISSFRAALEDVLNERLQAAVWVRLDTPVPRVLQRLDAIVGVTANALAAQGELTIGTRVVPLRIVNSPVLESRRLGLSVGSLAPGMLAVSEPLARQLRLTVGTPLQVGTCSLRIGGVFREYGNLRGRVVVARRSALGCVPLPQATEAELYGHVQMTDVRAALVGVSGAQVADQTRIRRVSLDIFDRTFRITDVVRSLSLLVAAIALFSSLTAWIDQRGAELGMLRAMGMTGRELGVLLALQSLLLGVLAVVLALPVGGVIAWVLVTQLQPRAFGWSFPLLLQWRAIVPTLLGALAAVLAGALLPAWALARAPATRWLAGARHG